MWACLSRVTHCSLRSKRFRGVGEQRKTKERYFARAKLGREPKKERGGGGGEGRKRLQTNPWILKTSVRQRTGLVIGWTSQTLLTSVDHRLAEEGEACLQKFLAERGLRRELRQYGGNPAQYRRLGTSKHAHYCRRKCDTIFVIFLLTALFEA